MDPLTLFGLFAVTCMLVFYALETRARVYTLGFAGACLLGSAYGFLQGAWPFGLVEAIWAIVAATKWWHLARGRGRPREDHDDGAGEMMLLVIGTVRLPPERVADARTAMERMVVASRAEEGCEAYFYAEDVLDPGLIHVKEIWRDQACLDAHFATDHLAAWRATWPTLGLKDRDLRVYDIEAPRPT